MTAPPRPVEAPQTLAAALGYLEHGWSVIPAPVAAKRALVEWKQWQTTRPSAQLWHTWAQRWPRANLAVITGALSGVVVVDVDTRHGGIQTLRQLEQIHGTLPATATVTTPGGGWHLYYRHPGGRVPNRQGRLGDRHAPGIDVRGDGGLALLPPSRRGEGAYEWWQGGPGAVVPLPPWLGASLPARPRPTDAPSTAATTRPDDDFLALRWAGIRRVVEQASEGTRNNRLFWAATCLRELPVDPATRGRLAGELEALAVSRGLDQREASRTIGSGLRRVIA